MAKCKREENGAGLETREHERNKTEKRTKNNKGQQIGEKTGARVGKEGSEVLRGEK